MADKTPGGGKRGREPHQEEQAAPNIHGLKG